MSDDTYKERLRCLNAVHATLKKTIMLPQVTAEQVLILTVVGLALQTIIGGGVVVAPGLEPPVAEPRINGRAGGSS